jgi:hypothetical protein
MATILHQPREGFLKIGLAAALGGMLLAAPAQARADELLVGAVRDQDGAIVAGASVTALDATGRAVARDRSAPDGTFALAAPSHPAAILIVAEDADPLRVAVPADGSPVAAIVRRHRAADRAPSVADVAALPAGSLSEIASVTPYWVAFPRTISNRWLARGRSATSVEGLKFYRRADGADAAPLLPSHAVGALDLRDSLQAPSYGDRAGGGIVDARLFDRADAFRATDGDASLEIGRDRAVFAATSLDPDGTRRLIAARAAQALGPLRASAVVLAGDAPGVHYEGVGAELRAATQQVDLGAHLALTNDDASTSTLRNAGNVTDVVLDASARGPNALALRGRWRDEHGVLGSAQSEHHDAALVLGTTRGNVVRANAALALAYGDEHAYDTGAATNGLALLPSLSVDAPLGENWSLHAGAGASTLGTPGFALARASLGEAGLAFSDHHGLRAEVLAYSEGATAPTAVNRGFAASIGWEIAPRLSLRAWTLRDGERFDVLTQLYSGAPVRTATGTNRFDRDLIWLTWDAPARFDVLYRAGMLEGNARVPIGRRYALTLGSYVRSDAKRALSIGLTAR